jgi:hypothetical protein
MPASKKISPITGIVQRYWHEEQEIVGASA